MTRDNRRQRKSFSKNRQQAKPKTRRQKRPALPKSFSVNQYTFLEDRTLLAGVTVITHGWQLGGLEDWTLTMGHAILSVADDPTTTDEEGSIFVHNPATGRWQPAAERFPGIWANTNSPDHHVVLVYDWALESNDSEEGWLEAAADNLFASLVDTNSYLPGFTGKSFVEWARVPNTTDYLDLHFIGHSRGAVVNSLVTARLGTTPEFKNLKVDHVTSLDPHPASNLFQSLGYFQLGMNDPGYNQYSPGDSILRTYSNVQFADNYFRRDGGNGIAGYELDSDFNGVRATGAYNFELNEGVLDNGGSLWEHADVHSWYYGTITESLWSGYDGYKSAGKNNDGDVSIPDNWHGQDPENIRGAVGFAFSSVRAVATRPAPNSELAKSTPVRISSVINGDFEFGDPHTNEIPGWERHGGNRNVDLVFDSNYRFVRLSGNADIRSNWLYLRSNATAIAMSVRSSGQLITDDQLVISIGDAIIATKNVNELTNVFSPTALEFFPLVAANRGVRQIRVQLVPGANLTFESTVDVNSIYQRLTGTTSSAIGSAFNAGMAAVRQNGQLGAVAGAGLGANLPVVSQNVEEMVSGTERISEPFENDLSNTTSLAAIRQSLEGLGFEVEQLALIPDEFGDFLRARYRKEWLATTELLSIGGKTGFDYFDIGVDGSLEGSLTANLLPVTLDVTIGLDVAGGIPSFYVADNGGLTVGGISIVGNGRGNLGIRNLLDVEVTARLEGSLSGGIYFSDFNEDGRIRPEQFSGPLNFVRGTLSGSIALENVQLTARLPVIGDLSWGGRWQATLNNGVVNIGSPQINPPDTAFVRQLLTNGYQQIAKAFDLFGGSDLKKDLPVVNKGLGEMLGLPKFLTDGSLGKAGFSIQVTPESVLDLINGKTVDLIRFEVPPGGGSFSKDISVPIIAGVIPLGPIPLAASLSFNTQINAGWSYYVGMGVDTSGFYIDPRTSISAYGSILAGLQTDISVAGIAGMNVTAGVGGSVSIAAGIYDPDPTDGRIYLDELLNQNSSSVGNALVNSMNVSLGGEAFGFAKGVARLLFWNWEVFNTRFTIADFKSQLLCVNRSASNNPTSQRKVTGRMPLLSVQELPDYRQNGVLTIKTHQEPYAGLDNTVSISDAGGGSVNVLWRGVGQRTYGPGEIQQIVLEGNANSDTFYVGENLIVPVTAYGHGGSDMITVVSGQATIYGGAGDDILRGGSADDFVYAGDGNDQVSGGSGVDRIWAGEGNDRVEGGDGNDWIYGEGGNDNLLGGLNVDRMIGGTGDDTLLGGSGNDVLYGDDGNDFLYGELHNDTLDGGNGNDFLIGGANADSLYGGVGNDQLYGDRGYATPEAGLLDGNDQLYGQGGDDRLFGEGGDDVLTGDDLGPGQIGNDLLVGDTGIDTLYGMDGNDQLLGGADSDVLYGGDGNESTTDDGDDVLNGGLGQDTLWGDAGNDTLQISFVHYKSDGTVDNVDDQTADDMHGGLGVDQIAVVGTAR